MYQQIDDLKIGAYKKEAAHPGHAIPLGDISRMSACSEHLPPAEEGNKKEWLLMEKWFFLGV